MALDSYNGLKSSIADHLDRDDLSDQIEDFISLAESRHRREVRIREMIERENLSLSGQFVDLPAGFLEAQTIRLLSDPARVMAEVTPSELIRWRRPGSGKPYYFTNHGTELEFDVVAESGLNAELVYYKALEPLSGSNSSNALLVRAPDAYLYGALIASSPFLMHDERIEIWGGLYRDAIASLRTSDRNSKKIGPIVSRVHRGGP